MKKIKYLGLLLVALTFGVGHAKAYVIISEDTTLDADINELVYVNGENVTIDLNGHNIIGDNGAIYAYDGVTLTIKGEGIIQSTDSNAIYSTDGATVILKSGTVKAQEFGVLVMGDSTFTMDGGTITTVDNCGVGGNGSDNDSYKNYTININGGTITSNIVSDGYVSCGIYHPNKGEVNISGGTINSTNGAGIVQRAGTLNITGGTINAQGNMTGKVGDSRVVVSASAIVIDREANYPEVGTLETNVSGATLNGDAGAVEVLGGGEGVTLTGGAYSSMPDEENIPEGYSAYEVLNTEEELYVVVKDDELEPSEPIIDEMNKEEVEEALEELYQTYLEYKNGTLEEELDEDDIAYLEMIKELKDILDKYTVVGYYDVSLDAVTPEGFIVGELNELDEAIDVSLTLPEDLPKVKEGFTRKYFVIRIHDDKVDVLDATDNGDGTITFASDKFSAYAVGYTDEEVKETKTETSPKTFDGVGMYMMIALVSILLGGCAVLKARKRFN